MTLARNVSTRLGTSGANIGVVTQGAAGDEAWLVEVTNEDIPALLHAVYLELVKMNQYNAINTGTVL